MNSVIDQESRFINSTPFEKMLAGIREESKEFQSKENQAENHRQNRYALIRSIACVYFFLQKGCGMLRRAITIEEYYLAREKLEDMGLEAIRVWWRRVLRFIGIRTSWHQFLEYGYFRKVSTPFGRCRGFYYDGCYYRTGIFKGIFKDWVIDKVLKDPTKFDKIVPVNLHELISKIESKAQLGVSNADSHN